MVTGIRASAARIERVLALVVFGWLGTRTVRLIHAAWLFTTDDAYITLRYARHLYEGHGIVWNVGETVPVEGYSNFLFVLLGAAALKVGIDPVVFIKVLSCTAIAPTCVLLYVLARRWLGPLAATLPAVLLTAHPGLVFWAVSGLETAVYQLLVVAATTAFIYGLDAPPGEPGRSGWSRSRLHLVAAALCLLASLARPEAPLLCVVLGLTALLQCGVRWIRARRHRDRGAEVDALRALGVSLRAFTFAFVLPFAVYFGWRVVHYGRLLPNTVYCKSTYSESGNPWTLIHDFWNEGKVLILLALVQDPRKLGTRALPLFLLPLAYAAILYGTDPIIGQHSRHFLAAIALLVVASSTGLSNLAALAVLPIRLIGRMLTRRQSSPSAEGAARRGGACGRRSLRRRSCSPVSSCTLAVSAGSRSKAARSSASRIEPTTTIRGGWPHRSTSPTTHPATRAATRGVSSSDATSTRHSPRSSHI